jgi:hypothetical protein
MPWRGSYHDLGYGDNRDFSGAGDRLIEIAMLQGLGDCLEPF